MNKQELKKAAAIMAAASEGAKIEYRNRREAYWTPGKESLVWDWFNYEYRVALEKPSINWEHVSDVFIAMAIDRSGVAWLYETIPKKQSSAWWAEGAMQAAFPFASFKPGKTGWKTSLIHRPNLQYYHANDYCPAVSGDDDCTCWHDIGTGPHANDINAPTIWKIKE